MDALILLPLAAGAVVVALALSNQSTRRRRQTWAAVATRRGGRLIIPRGWFTREHERIEVPFAGGTLELDTYATGSSNNRTHWTRCTGVYTHAGGPRMKVYREGFFSALGKALGTQDVVLGTDPTFDRTFMIKCDEPAVVRRLWTPRAMEMMSGVFEKARVESDGSAVQLIEAGVITDAVRLEAALDLVAELVDQDLFGAVALRELAGDGGFRRDGDGRPEATIDAPARVTFRAEDVDGQLRTVARLGGDAEVDPLELRLDERGRPEPADLTSRLPQGAQMRLREVGAGTLVVEPGATRFTWNAVETDRARLRVGAELLGALTTASVGVYR